MGKNRLAESVSPYLLQHATNPVDWFPWGDEALSRARELDRPILLSIGYSACHWCHVMERESFSNADLAAFMNERFVSIKVDREERPDLDQIYQLVVQLMGRNGGWPLTVFMTPDCQPFFGGTYFPPEDKYGMPGFRKLLEAIAESYATERPALLEQAQEITRGIGKVLAPPSAASSGANGGQAVAFKRDLLAQSAARLARSWDDENGGFGTRPKFPNVSALDLFVCAYGNAGDAPSGVRVSTVLAKMRAGGVYDQLGGGFHRYSTDAVWLVPHFEKMLYDNAQLLQLYADGARLFPDASHALTCEEIVDYLAREMTREDGVFFAAQDADSAGEEGTFFVWKPAQVKDAVAGDTFATDVAVRAYGINESGNFEESGASVLSRSASVGNIALAVGAPASRVSEALGNASRAMFAARELREKPFRDEKVLTSWNAMTIGALADAGMACQRPEWVAAAERAFARLWEIAVVPIDEASSDPDASLPRLRRLALGPRVQGSGFLDDYALFANAALELYEATGAPTYAARADALTRSMIRFFYRENEGFAFTPAGGEALIVRPRDIHDGAVPSATSVACRVLVRSAERANDAWATLAERELMRLAGDLAKTPMAHAHAIATVDRLVRGATSIVLVGAANSEALRALARVVHSRYVPNRAIVWVDPDDVASVRAGGTFAHGKTAGKDGEPNAYVCVGRTCLPPESSPGSLTSALDEALRIARA